MIPNVWTSTILVLAAFRLTRLVGWDHLPPLVAARAWLSGEHATNRGSANSRMNLTSERPEVRIAHRRPFWDLLFSCAYCLGLWVSGGLYAFWVEKPTWALYVAAPFSLSAAVGLIARFLDP